MTVVDVELVRMLRAVIHHEKRRCVLSTIFLAGSLLSTGCGTTMKVAELVASGDERVLRKRPPGSPESSPQHPPVLLVDIDGVDRNLLYPMLERGELPHLAKIFGRDAQGAFPHAYFDKEILSVLPSSTMVAWATTLTGVSPAEHGIAGNEFFLRESRVFAAPVPVTFSDPKPVLECYTNDYVDEKLFQPTLFTRLRQQDPDVLIWVAMQQMHGGADVLYRTNRFVLRDAFQAFVEDALEHDHGRKAFEKIDREAVKGVVDALKKRPTPDLLTLYLSGADQYAHAAAEGPTEARTSYLKEVIDPLVGEVADALAAHDQHGNRYVVTVADHGHTEVMRDTQHALSMDDKDDPPGVLTRAGFRVRPFTLDVDPKADFQAVLAYQGAMAYVYVADRSGCPDAGQTCAWEKPPRYEGDVIPVADAFFKADRDGALVPAMKGTLDMVLVRHPKPIAEVDDPFEVYVGEGRAVPMGEFLRGSPRPTYLAFEERMRDLAVGLHGERAGDVILLAHNGDREKPEERYYFAGLYRSWHGSPSARDSEIPLIVSNPSKTTEQIEKLVRGATGPSPRQRNVTDVVMAIRHEAR